MKTRLLVLLIAAVVVPACHNGDAVRRTTPPQGGSTTLLKAATLSGRQEAPPVVTTATGSATVSVDPGLGQIVVTVTVSGLSDITDAHLHVGPPGMDGPIIFPLASGPFTSPLVVTLTSSNLVPAPAQGIDTIGDAIQAIQGGRTYVNVHTTAFPDGELRGQVGPVEFGAVLSGTQEVPPVVTSATGSTSLSINPDQTLFQALLSTPGLLGVTGAHIHLGAEGEDGPVIFTLVSGSYGSTLITELSAANLTPQPGAMTFEEAIDAILTGNAYVNVHTNAHPEGEIRGQIRPSVTPVVVTPPTTDPPTVVIPPPVIIGPYFR